MSGRELVFEPRHLVAQQKLSLLQPLHLQLVGLAGVSQRLDRRVEVAVLLAQPLDLGDQRGVFLRREPLVVHSRHSTQAFRASTPSARQARRDSYDGVGLHRASSLPRRRLAGNLTLYDRHCCKMR